MKHVFLLIVLNLPLITGATNGGPMPEWFEGSLVLVNDEVRLGEISIHANVDVILFRAGDEVTVYPAHRVSSVFFFDPRENINRRYVSIERSEGRSTVNLLYEVVVSGQLSVLRKKKDFTARYSQDARDFVYFILNGRELVPLRKFSRDVLPVFPDADKVVITQYARSERLNPNQASDIIQLIVFYNRYYLEHSPIAKK